MASGSNQHWTITEAVERTNASNSTIRRYRAQDKFPNAYKDSDGVWKYPVEDLLAAGIKILSTEDQEKAAKQREQVSKKPEQVVSSPEQPSPKSTEQVPLEQVQLTIREKDFRILELELKLQAAEDKIQYLTKENERAEERLRAEKDSVREQITLLRQTMAMIEPSKKPEQHEHPVQSVAQSTPEHTKEQPSEPAQNKVNTPIEHPVEQPKKKSWWRR